MSFIKRVSICFILVLLLGIANNSPIESKSYTGGTFEYVRQDNETIRVAFKYKRDCDMWVDFSKAGINSIMGISNIYFAENTGTLVAQDLSRSATPIIKANTDWIGPYIIKAKASGDSSSPSFTGGWHGAGLNGKIVPTARTLSWKAYANNMEILPGEVIGCEKADLYVTNLVQAYNTVPRLTNKEVLQEKIHYCIERCKINVTVEITALEDLTISKYYGLQVQNKPWMDEVFYQNGNRYKEGISVEKSTSSGNKRNNPGVSVFKLYPKDMRYGLAVRLDRTYGLGRMNDVSWDNPCAFTIGYGKTYFNLINGKDKILKKGQKLYWRGEYSFI